MKRVYYLLPALLSLAYLVVPNAVLLAAQSAESSIVVVADREAGAFAKFWIDQYNTSPYMFGLWCTIFTAGLGVVLGFITDQLMKLTGLDLTSRDVIEH
jgi:ABC-type Fe3+ transport system permease subunit